MLLKWLVRCSHANWGNYVRKHTILWWFNFSTRKTHTHLHIMYCGTKKITRLWAEVESKTQKPKTTFHLSSFELGSVWKRANFGNFCRSSLRDDHVNATAKAITIWWACECHVWVRIRLCECVCFEFHSLKQLAGQPCTATNLAKTSRVAIKTQLQRLPAAV